MEAHLQMNNNNKITHEQQQQQQQQQKDQSTYISYSIFKNAIEEAGYT